LTKPPKTSKRKLQIRKYTNKQPLVLLIAMLTLSSCNKKLSHIFSGQPDLVVDDVNFDYMSSKAKIDYSSSNNSLSATANIRIQKDSIIWISLSPGLGIEAARLLVTRDSVVVIDKINKVYFNYGYDTLSKKLDYHLSYGLIESVIIGNLIYPYEREELIKTNGTYAYAQKQSSFLFENYIGLDTKKLEKIEVLDTLNKNTVSVEYDDFRLVNEEVFPFEIRALLEYADDSKKETKVDIIFKQTQLPEKPLRFPFNISQKYERK